MSCEFPHRPPAMVRLSLAHLMLAIRTDNIEALKSLFDLHGPPDTKLRSQLYHFLCKSLLDKKEDMAKLLLECGANVNVTTSDIKTPLHHAAEKGYTKVVSMLLDKGALVNAKDDCNKTSLHCAVERGNLKIIVLLLNKMANIEAKTKDGLTSLHLAVKLLGQAQVSKDNFDHKLASRCKLCTSNLKVAMDTTDATRTYTTREKVVKLLLDRGADVDARNNYRKTVLQVAVEQCNFGIIERILLSRPAVEDKGNEHCLRFALESAGLEYRGIVELLVDYGFTLKGRDAKDPGLLHDAVRNGHTKIVDDLLKLGADVEVKQKIASASNGTLLHSAAANGRIRIAELLLERGANVNAEDTNYKTPIVYAVENMDPAMTKLFLTNGANDEGAPSLLHTAAERGCRHIMEMILDKIPSIDVNAVDNDPRHRSAKLVNHMFTVGTALHVAVAGGFATVVELLLEHKATVDFLAEKVGTPLHCSVSQRDEAIVKMLLLKGAKVDARREDGTTPLHLALKEGNAKAFKVLIKHGADVHKRNNKGLNLVHMATEHERLKMFEEDLLDVFRAGHPETNDGLTALHMAVRMGSLENVEILLRHGADASVKGKNSVTPLHDAASGDLEGRVTEALLNSLDYVDTTDRNRHTAHHTAAEEGNLTAVRLLIFHGCDVNIKDKLGRTPLKIINWKYWNQLGTIIEERIVKMMALGLYVDPSNTCCDGTYDRCSKEIESMKRTKIAESKVSFYEFLTAGKCQLAFYSRNQAIAEALERGDHMDTFKLYCDMIDWRFRKMKIINDMKDSSARSLSALSGYSLSDYDYMKIFGYLDRRDLENVIKAGASDEKSKKRRYLEFESRLKKKKNRMKKFECILFIRTSRIYGYLSDILYIIYTLELLAIYYILL